MSGPRTPHAPDPPLSSRPCPRPSTPTSPRSTPRTCPIAAGRSTTGSRSWRGVDPDAFGICLATVDGYLYEVGDTRTRLHDPVDLEDVHLRARARRPRLRRRSTRKIDVEPSGEAFYEISLEPGDRACRRNAMINAGAIAACSLVAGDTLEERYARVRVDVLARRRPRARARRGDLPRRPRGRPPPPRDRPPAARLGRDRGRPRPGRRALLPPVRAAARLPRPRADGGHAGQRRRAAAHRRAASSSPRSSSAC